MPLYYFGFNGFRQFSSDSTGKFGPLELELNFKDLDISWSKLSYISGDGTLRISSLPSGSSEQDRDNECCGQESFVKVSCADQHLSAITPDGIGKLYEVKEGKPREIFKVIAGDTNRFADCCIGDKDAVFINQAGRVVWICLDSASLESPILPIAWSIVSAACGKEHVLLLSETGTVYSFGNGSARFFSK